MMTGKEPVNETLMEGYYTRNERVTLLLCSKKKVHLPFFSFCLLDSFVDFMASRTEDLLQDLETSAQLRFRQWKDLLDHHLSEEIDRT